MLSLLATIRERAASGRLQRFAREQNATTAVEFAFIAPILFATIVATLQISIIFFAQSYLAVVTDATARSVLTNQTINWTSTNYAANLQSSLCANATAMFSCAGLTVSLQPAPTTPAGVASALPTFDAQGNLKNPATASCIPPNTKALLVVMYQWPVIAGPLGAYFGTLGNGKYLLTATQVFQTEPPSGSQACAS